MTIDERYAEYLEWCLARNLKVGMTPLEYEKELAKIPEMALNNVDMILIKKKRDA